jgi:hypothetical protein
MPFVFNPFSGTLDWTAAGGGAETDPVFSASAAAGIDAADITNWDGKQSALTFPLSPTLGGTGVNNGSNNLTVPATGTAALLATANVFTAAQTVTVDDATDNNTTTVLSVQHTTSGSPAAGMGVEIALGLENSTGNITANAGRIVADWINPTTGVSFLKFGFGSNFPFELRPTGIVFNAPSAGNGDIIFNMQDGGTAVLRVTKNSANGVMFVSQAYASRVALRIIANASSTADLQTWVTSGGTILASVSNNGVGLHNPITTTTNAVLDAMKLQASVSTASTGGAAGFGVGQSFYAETATDGTNQQQGLISTSWIDATNASRKAKMSLSAYDTAARLGLEIEASGTAAKLGFYGVATVARATNALAAGAFVANTSGIANDTATFGGYTIGQVVQALINIGVLT